MVTSSERSTLIISIISRALGVFYGVLSLLHFKSAENLNIWILSSYVATVVTLANIIVQPSQQDYVNPDRTFINFFGKEFSRIVFRRVFLAFAFQIFLSISVVVLTDLNVSPAYIVGIFLYQSLQYPFLFRILHRNEVNYFKQSRIHLLRASFVGNIISLSSILGFYLLDIFIDSTIETFIIFITFQIISLAVQDGMYTFETRFASEFTQDCSNRILAHRARFFKKFVPGLRTYIYVPCIASFWLFVQDPLDPEITSIFLGLNLVTLLTYLGLPNDKAGYVVGNVVDLKRSLVRIMTRSVSLYLLLFSCLLIALFTSNNNGFAALIINSENITSMALLSFIGLFLLPIVLLGNNQKRDIRSNFDVLDITVLTLIASFATLLFLAKFSATACIALSYITSFIIWYTITVWNIGKKASIESSW